MRACRMCMGSSFSTGPPFDFGREIGQGRVERTQEALERGPAEIDPPALHARNVSRIDVHAGTELFLRDARPLAQPAERLPKGALAVLIAGVHRPPSRTLHNWQGALVLARPEHTSWRPRGSDRRAPWHRKRELPARQTPYRERVGRLPR
jgi:hypothetical protein